MLKVIKTINDLFMEVLNKDNDSFVQYYLNSINQMI